MSSLFPKDAPALVVQDTSFSPSLPLALKFGDANLDGFPDFAMIGASDSHRVPYLVFSVPCGKGVSGCDADGSGRRGWKVAQKGADALKLVNDARSISFLDMDEDVGQPSFPFTVLINTFPGNAGHDDSTIRSRRARAYIIRPE